MEQIVGYVEGFHRGIIRYGVHYHDHNPLNLGVQIQVKEIANPDAEWVLERIREFVKPYRRL